MTHRPLLLRIINPGVPWWIAAPCDTLAGAALILLIVEPVRYFAAAMALLIPAAVVLYGTAAVMAIAARVRSRTQRP